MCCGRDARERDLVDTFLKVFIFSPGDVSKYRVLSSTIIYYINYTFSTSHHIQYSIY